MTLSPPPKSYVFFLIITLIILGLVGYLGFRTIEHQILLKRYQAEALAKSHLSEAEKFINNLLAQKAIRLDAITNFLQLNDNALKEFINKDTDVNDIFILRHNKLFYPKPNTLSQKQQTLIENITPIIHDPSLLSTPNINNEKIQPHTGWYINHNSQTPLLIYWRNKKDLTIGFCLSYIKLLSEVVNTANFNHNDGILTITENGRLLYQSSTHLNNPKLITSRSLAYPLINWQVSYYSAQTSSLMTYLWGIIFIFLLLSIIGLIMYRLYREYTQAARLALQQVNFVSQVSHELKTPLTNISLYAELLKEEQEEQEALGLNYTEVIISESKRLSRLIQNILNFTQIPKLHPTTFNLSELITQIAQPFAPSFHNKGLKLVLNVPPHIMITSDIDRITQIVYNFLSNAEKYANQGKQVDITIIKQTNYIDIQVRDYGKGITLKEQKLIFQPFYRVKSAITEGVSGTGIGLTIAKQLATSLHAEILVSNATPGACFTLRLWQTVTNQSTGNPV